jgi:hypothetical protein
MSAEMPQTVSQDRCPWCARAIDPEGAEGWVQLGLGLPMLHWGCWHSSHRTHRP